MDPMDAEAEPVFPLSVPMSLWREFAKTFSPAFADSYLYGAKLRDATLIPRTLTGYLKLHEATAHQVVRGETVATAGSKLMERLHLRLVRPAPFQESGQMSVREIMSNSFKDKKK